MTLAVPRIRQNGDVYIMHITLGIMHIKPVSIVAAKVLRYAGMVAKYFSFQNLVGVYV